MPDIDKIRQDLADTAKYHGMSYAAIVGVASEIEAVEDKQERAALRREFRELHALTSQVWARVADRFPGYARTDHDISAQWVRAAAYCCQLPKQECVDLFETHLDHLDEPGALGLVLRDVNDALDARRNGHGAKRETLAEQCAELVFEWRDDGLVTRLQCAGQLAELPAVAAVLAKRGRAEK